MPGVPVNADVGLVGVVTAPPVPLTMLHEPMPMTGVLPAKVVPVAQIVWSEPALATVGVAVNVITTSSVEATQGAFATVQRSV